MTDSPIHVRELQWIEPVTAADCLSHRGQLAFLDSAARQEFLGRFSYVACDPFSTYTIVGGRVSCKEVALQGDPWEVLRSLLAEYRQEHRPDLPPFQGGAAGFLAYDLNRTLEKLPVPPIPGLGMADSILHFYDVVVSSITVTADAGSFPPDGRSSILRVGARVHAAAPMNLQAC